VEFEPANIQERRLYRVWQQPLGVLNLARDTGEDEFVFLNLEFAGEKI